MKLIEIISNMSGPKQRLTLIFSAPFIVIGLVLVNTNFCMDKPIRSRIGRMQWAMGRLLQGYNCKRTRESSSPPQFQFPKYRIRKGWWKWGGVITKSQKNSTKTEKGKFEVYLSPASFFFCLHIQSIPYALFLLEGERGPFAHSVVVLGVGGGDRRRIGTHTWEERLCMWYWEGEWQLDMQLMNLWREAFLMANSVSFLKNL